MFRTRVFKTGRNYFYYGHVSRAECRTKSQYKDW